MLLQFHLDIIPIIIVFNNIIRIFENIPGIGPKRIKKIWQEFESIEEIQNSNTTVIRQKTGFSEKLCGAIKAHLAELKS